MDRFPPRQSLRKSLIAYDGGSPATHVRIRGARHRVVERRANGTRVYFRLDDGASIILDRAEQIDLAYRCDLTSDTSWVDVNVKYAEALSVDWGPGGFTELEIESAYHKLKYLAALDAYDAKQRVKKKIIDKACLQARLDNPELPETPPSVDSIKRWDYRWLASGRDIRVLADRHQDRGFHGGIPELKWITDFLLDKIEEKMLQSPYFTPKQLEEYVKPMIAAKAEAEKLPLDPRLGHQRYFGVHRIATLYKQLTQEEILRTTVGKREAARQGKGSSTGPTGDYALHEVEADHHQMDIDVVLPNGSRWGRPWLTVIFDRYSRMVLGYYLTMEPPSWFSVLMALRMAVLPKQDYLASLNYRFEFDWRCWGSPEFLYVDRGAEFHSRTMKAAASALNITAIDVPRARGDLKGKIERWFGTFANGEVSKLPGHLGNSPKKRIKEKAKPRLTLADVNLICAVFIVDIHNNRRHGTTLQWPSKRFTSSIEGGMMDKLPPPIELLGPATSKAVIGKLTSEGVFVDGCVYRADALRRLWNKNGRTPVLCRPDEADGTRMLVHDGGRKFIEATLSGKYRGQKITRAELALLRAADNDLSETPEDHQRQLRASGGYHEFVDSLSPKPHKVRRGVQRTTPVQHLTKPTHNPEASAAPFVGFDSEVQIIADKYDAAGNYDGPTISQQVFEAGGFDPDNSWNIARKNKNHSSPVPALPASASTGPGEPAADPPVAAAMPPSPPPDDEDDGIIRL